MSARVFGSVQNKTNDGIRLSTPCNSTEDETSEMKLDSHRKNIASPRFHSSSTFHTAPSGINDSNGCSQFCTGGQISTAIYIPFPALHAFRPADPRKADLEGSRERENREWLKEIMEKDKKDEEDKLAADAMAKDIAIPKVAQAAYRAKGLERKGDMKAEGCALKVKRQKECAGACALAVNEQRIILLLKRLHLFDALCGAMQS